MFLFVTGRVAFCNIVHPSYADAMLRLSGARILDPAQAKTLEDRDILIEGGRIAAIEKSKGERELKGLTLLPGLIDLHSHLLLYPYDRKPWIDQVRHNTGRISRK
jgi:imidazolonepropionase-like amidohydrolase